MLNIMIKEKHLLPKVSTYFVFRNTSVFNILVIIYLFRTKQILGSCTTVSSTRKMINADRRRLKASLRKKFVSFLFAIFDDFYNAPIPKSQYY